MPMISVPVLKPLTYQGRSYVPGERVAMRPADALVAARRREVDLTKRSRTIETRHMEAEQTAPPTAPQRALGARTRPASPKPPSSGKGRGGRYQRRDVTPDSTTAMTAGTSPESDTPDE